MNGRLLQIFTTQLYELIARQQLNLTDALKVMAGSSRRSIHEVALEIQRELGRGFLLSEALVKTVSIKFDPVYVLFIKFSEHTGDLGKCLEFLKNRCERKTENVQRILEAGVYPLFVVLLATGLSIVFFVYCRKESFQDFLSADMKAIVFRGVFLLFVFCLLFMYLLVKNVGENKLYEAFLGMGFLSNSGVNVALVVGYGMLIVGPDSRLGKFFSQARQRLEYGMDLKSAFGFEGRWSIGISSNTKREIQEFFHFANTSGNEGKVFEQIALNMGLKDEKKRKLCLSLVEPVFIALTGIFLIIILTNLLLPYFTNMFVV